MQYKGITLDPFQERACRVIDDAESLIVAAPTGAGKTLVAEYAIERCVAEGARVLYTAPIKALSNQKFRDFTRLYGDRVGIKTGDVTLNPDAQVILMTTEIYRNTIFESPESFHDVRYVIFDEIHYLDDIERGTVWEESIIFAPPHIRVLCLSATVPNLEAMASWIRSIHADVPLHIILEENRPVPLRHSLYIPGIGFKSVDDVRKLDPWRARGRGRRVDPDMNPDRWRGELINHLADKDRLPAIWFTFNRRDCEGFASRVERPLLTEENRQRMMKAYADLLKRFDIPPDSTTEHLGRLLSRGVAYHHAGLLPTLKEVIERIFTTGLLKLLFATETFAVGVNMPARSVVFNSLLKYDGRRLGPIKTREHHQMSGRAGRRGIDTVGYVYSVAEWPRMRARDIEKVLRGDIEPIRSQFNLSYATLLTLWERLGDRITTAAEKSFANFTGARRGNRSIKGKVSLIRRKLGVLNDLGYIRKGKLTEKGRFARQIQGYELPVTELLFAGVLSSLSPERICLLFHAIVYEPKKGDWARKMHDGWFRHLRKSAYRALDGVIRAEHGADLGEQTKPLEFKLASAVWAWARGAEWRELEAHTGASDGDLVRFIRMAVQLLRDAMHALPREDGLRPRLREAVEMLNRDVVDAERQLRMGTEGPEENPDPEAEAASAQP